MKDPDDRYLLRKETDGSLSICDRQIIETLRDQRIVIGLRQDQANDLVKKLNTRRGDGAK